MTRQWRGRTAERQADPMARAVESIIAWSNGGPTHAELEDLVNSVARSLGWRIHEIHDSTGEDWAADSGWPDVFLVKGDRAVAIEVKIPPDDLTAEQRVWLVALDAVPGITARVLKPSGRGYTADLTAIAELLG